MKKIFRDCWCENIETTWTGIEILFRYSDDTPVRIRLDWLSVPGLIRDLVKARAKLKSMSERHLNEIDEALRS